METATLWNKEEESNHLVHTPTGKKRINSASYFTRRTPRGISGAPEIIRHFGAKPVQR